MNESMGAGGPSVADLYVNYGTDEPSCGGDWGTAASFYADAVESAEDPDGYSLEAEQANTSGPVDGDAGAKA